MTRGGRRKDRDGPERRCVATGESGPVAPLIRFVLSPDGVAVPDLAERLSGRGAWLTADRALAEKAVRKRLFSRAFRQPVEVAADLPDMLERLLAQRLVDLVSLARRAGQAVAGAEKVRARLVAGNAAVLFQASDGAPDGTTKMAALAAAAGNGAVQRIALLTSAELGLAFGREFAIHAALDAGGFAQRALRDSERLSGFRRWGGCGEPLDSRPGAASRQSDGDDMGERDSRSSGQGD